MNDFEFLLCAALALGFGYLRYGRGVLLKRLVLPIATAAVAALLALALARYNGTDFFAWAISISLALSAGMLLQHLFDFCRGCGAARRLERRVAARRDFSQVTPHHCPHCRVGRVTVR
jgi:hypothetical protein